MIECAYCRRLYEGIHACAAEWVSAILNANPVTVSVRGENGWMTLNDAIDALQTDNREVVSQVDDPSGSVSRFYCPGEANPVDEVELGLKYRMIRFEVDGIEYLHPEARMDVGEDERPQTVRPMIQSLRLGASSASGNPYESSAERLRWHQEYTVKGVRPWAGVEWDPEIRL